MRGKNHAAPAAGANRPVCQGDVRGAQDLLADGGHHLVGPLSSGKRTAISSAEAASVTQTVHLCNGVVAEQGGGDARGRCRVLVGGRAVRHQRRGDLVAGRSLRTCFLCLFLCAFFWTENLVFSRARSLSKQSVFRKCFLPKILGREGGLDVWTIRWLRELFLLCQLVVKLGARAAMDIYGGDADELAHCVALHNWAKIRDVSFRSRSCWYGARADFAIAF